MDTCLLLHHSATRGYFEHWLYRGRLSAAVMRFAQLTLCAERWLSNSVARLLDGTYT